MDGVPQDAGDVTFVDGPLWMESDGATRSGNQGWQRALVHFISIEEKETATSTTERSRKP